MTKRGTSPSLTKRYQIAISARWARIASATRPSFVSIMDSPQPFLQVGAHERVIGEIGVLGADALDLLRLPRRKRLLRVEAPDALEQPLAPQDFVAARDAAREMVG